MDINKVSSKPVRMLYFWCGIIATLAYRIIIVLTDVDLFWTKLAWYVGTIGFVLYFAHRFQIANKRERVVEELKLEQKLDNVAGLSDEDRAGIKFLFHSLKVSSERWIYIWIFVTSGLALIAGIYLDFIAK